MVRLQENLFVKAKRGDVEAFEKLTQGYYKQIFNIALKATGSSKAASELAQEVFVRLFRRVDSLESENLLRGLLFQIVCKVCLTGDGYSQRTPEPECEGAVVNFQP